MLWRKSMVDAARANFYAKSKIAKTAQSLTGLRCCDAGWIHEMETKALSKIEALEQMRITELKSAKTCESVDTAMTKFYKELERIIDSAFALPATDRVV